MVDFEGLVVGTVKSVRGAAGREIARAHGTP